jgi:hypothetical protein
MAHHLDDADSEAYDPSYDHPPQQSPLAQYHSPPPPQQQVYAQQAQLEGHHSTTYDFTPGLAQPERQAPGGDHEEYRSQGYTPQSTPSGSPYASPARSTASSASSAHVTPSAGYYHQQQQQQQASPTSSAYQQTTNASQYVTPEYLALLQAQAQSQARYHTAQQPGQYAEIPQVQAGHGHHHHHHEEEEGGQALDAPDRDLSAELHASVSSSSSSKSGSPSTQGHHHHGAHKHYDQKPLPGGGGGRGGEYPQLNHTPGAKWIKHLTRSRLDTFTGGHYSDVNLSSVLFERRESGSEWVKLRV